ncbi:UDP-N-acetylmuramoyl-L-alanine--D-glutamate ligase [Patescibacteria group bacterium]|nr:UDP-N-acetylmuramoyl-L-alanine--D-glutamate ligase [Patescibacteria group bacterium]
MKLDFKNNPHDAKAMRGKKVAVLGLGIEGLSSARFLAGRGAKVSVFDKREKSKIETTYLKALEKLGIDFYGGENYLEKLNNFDLVVRSPGVRLDKVKSPKSKAQSQIITSQTKLFFDLCPCKIVGITGTKGKGTTSALLYEILKNAEKDVYLGGNIGLPPLEFLDNLNPQSITILELSSFQLMDLEKSPNIAIMLMTVPEHLNYHENMEEYVEAKRNLVRFQKSSDYAILNYDYPASNESDILTDGKVYKISRENQVLSEAVFIKNKTIWFRENGKEEFVIDCKDILLKGEHNLENVSAAIIASKILGVSVPKIVSVLKTFKGLEHRLELVSIVEDVKYYDDSFSTTPETAIAAIKAFKEPEILILGGSSKNSDFKELGEVISNAGNIKAIIGIGQEWEKIKPEIKDVRIILVEGAKTMSQIVAAASKIAKPENVVLLTPACASFGMFKNYKERGEQFKQEVFRLNSKFKIQNAK